MADPLSLAVLSARITGLLMRGAAVAVDPSWGSAASLPNEVLNTWRSMWGLLQGRGAEENPLEASIKARLQKQVDNASERYERTAATQSALAGAVTEMEVALKELSGDDATVLEAVRLPDNFETYLRRRAAGRRQNVEAAAEPFFDDLTRIVADEFIRLAPGSQAFDIAALKQLLAGQEQLLAGQEQLLEGQAETHKSQERLLAGQTQLLDQHTKTHERLDKIVDSINNTRNTPPQSQNVPKRIRFGSRPRVTTGFVEREGQDELFNAIFTRAEPRTVLTGMRGSGKTQLAATVATRCEEEGWPLVAWIDAESRDVLIANLYNLALQTGIDAPKDIPPETIIRRFLDQLRSANAADRLFVFDNVENLDDLRDLTPEGNGVRALITTTRHLDWNSLGWSPLAVGVFDREQSIALLCQRTGDAHRDAADQIAEALGDLPVAVTQAAATAQQGGYTLSGYLDRLSNHPLDSSISRFEGDDYPDAIGIALFMAYEHALEQIRTKHPQHERSAVSLLDALSLLAASGVPTHWLLNLDDDSDAVRDTLSFLKRALILQESIDSDKTIIHRLQGKVYRETYLSNPEKLSEARSCATIVLNGVEVTRSNLFQQRQETRSLVEQMRSITSQDYSYSLFSNPAFVLTLATTLRYSTNLGMSQLALTLTDSVTQAGCILGPDHASTLASRNNLAYAYQDAGRLNEAITLFEKNLKDLTRILGPDHPGTLASRHNLAGAYRDAGRLDEAIELHEQNFEESERILGPGHPGTLASRNNLAGAYREAGRLNDAITLHKQNLEDLTHILGPDHPDTLASRNNLAYAYQDAGRLNDAITLHKQTLEDRTHILGPDHPDTLASRNNLASAYQDAGRLNDAITLYEQTLEDRSHILGPHHPDTLTSRNNLASAYRDAGRLNDAITLHKQTLEDADRILGPHHPSTLTSRNNLAYAYRAAGRLNDAITLHQQNLEDADRILGPHHPSTLTIRNNLAYAYRAAGRLNDAITLHQQNLEDFENLLGPNHPLTLTSRNNLADAYSAAGRAEEAEALLETPSDSEDEQDGTEEIGN
ncbi:tetratricopeptide repeat protein [Actinomyces sp. HMT 175]|uniref:tetratricopeptide repeat protein n=1 Tax=Actinomyces sp. HMT 175 TaxID=2789425 RepID=UPI0019177E69|nr:tetratricopeptide repeat protein [Actinomyces sp. HMT 175]QQQ58725.1 ATP-binding protein [Actinomyces sp. HMT 175]